MEFVKYYTPSEHNPFENVAHKTPPKQPDEMIIVVLYKLICLSHCRWGYWQRIVSDLSVSVPKRVTSNSSVLFNIRNNLSYMLICSGRLLSCTIVVCIVIHAFNQKIPEMPTISDESVMYVCVCCWLDLLSMCECRVCVRVCICQRSCECVRSRT